MDSKAVYVFFLILCATFYGFSQGDTDVRIKISAVTTAGCTDTVRFMRDQLIPTYTEFRRFLEVEFIPWGRTIQNGDGSLTCQFGPPDCWANRVHRCALDMLKNNQDAQISYMACEFHDFNSRPAFLDESYICAFFAGLNRVTLNGCVTTFLGDPLDYAAQAASAEPMSVINFVPAIFLNDVPLPSPEWHDNFLNLRDVICNKLAEDPSTGVTDC